MCQTFAPMNIFQHFSCHTKLPVKLEDIKDHILETGIVTRITRYPVTYNELVMQGALRIYEDLRPYVTAGSNYAEVLYSDTLAEPEIRLVCAKEMLHILNGHQATVTTMEQVTQLVNQLAIGSVAESLGIPATFDKVGPYHALCVLMPECALDLIKDGIAAHKTTPEKAAILANIPLPYMRLALEPVWTSMMKLIT